MHKVHTKRSPLCAVWPPVVWLQWPWISGVCGAPPCCESPAASDSAAEPPELALACHSLRTDHRKYKAENAKPEKNSHRQRHMWKRTWDLHETPLRTTGYHRESDSSSSYRVTLRCQSVCRRRGCWAAAAVVRVRNAEPGPRRAASYTGAGHLRSQPNLDWPRPLVHRAETPNSPLPLTSIHQPWGRGKHADFKHGQLIEQSQVTERWRDTRKVR